VPIGDVDELDDAELVVRIARRDERALGEILRRHRGPTIAFARRLVADDALAEDVAQEVFLRLWQRPERYNRERGALRAFLLAQTHGRAIDRVRSDTARRRREERDAAISRDPQPAADKPVVERAVADEIRHALGRLSEEEQKAVELAYFGGHSYREVARILDIPEGTVKGRIRTALSKLREALAERDLLMP
jgi:RNA polymerase sigma-70 factor (ECF subfamily)